jgi:hypothetical protein
VCSITFSISCITVDLVYISLTSAPKLNCSRLRQDPHISIVFPAPATDKVQHHHLILVPKNLRMPLIQSFDSSVDSQLLKSDPSVNHIPVPGCLSRMLESCHFRASTSPKILNIFCRSSPRGGSLVDTPPELRGQDQLITIFRLSARSASRPSLIP